MLGLPTGDLQQLDWSVSESPPDLQGVHYLRLRVCRPPSHTDDDASRLAVLNQASPMRCLEWLGRPIPTIRQTRGAMLSGTTSAWQ